ncbi:MAG: hypothetical protein JW934_04860 [Anaerolineae bacterium]|nr:hypothetical protein [Anaerolineae bacterium]
MPRQQGFLRWMLLLACTLGLTLAWLPLASADGRWRHFTAPTEGEPDPNKTLRSNHIQALAFEVSDIPGQSRLWVGADRGLQTYNGRSWQDQTELATGQKEASITALAVDPYGKVWVGTAAGVSWLHGDLQNRTIKNGGMVVRSMAAAGQDIYVGTVGQGVWRCTEADECAQIISTDVLNNSTVTALQPIEDMLWIGTPDRLLLFDLTTGSTIKEALSENAITGLDVDPQGRLWIAFNGGVTRYDPRKDEWKSFYIGNVNSITADDRGRIWAAGGDKLLMWDVRWEGRPLPPDEWRIVEYKQPNQIQLVLAAPDGMLWVGTSGGLSGFDGSWESHTSPRLSSEANARVLVNTLIRDPDTGELWAGTNVGVIHYQPATDQWDEKWTVDDGLASDYIRDLLRDHRTGEIWVATNAGISYYDPASRTWNRTWTTQDELWSNDVYALIRNPDSGTILAGGLGGISEFNPVTRRWTQMQQTGTGGDQIVFMALAYDSTTRKIWAGTDQGVWGINSAQSSWQPVDMFIQNQQTPAASQYVGAVAALDGKLWVGIKNQVLEYSSAGWAVRDTLEQGESTTITTLLADPENGMLWVGSNSGISRFDLRAGKWNGTWTTAVGLGNDTISTIVFGETTNELWIGTGDGVSHYNPNLGPRPWVLVNRALSDEQNVLQGDTVNLYHSTDVDFLLTGGSLIAETSELSYLYKFRAWGDEPAEQGEIQNLDISRSNLKRGRKYELEVWARDREGRESEVQNYYVNVSILPFRIGLLESGSVMLWTVLLAVLFTGAAIYSLRSYPAYAVGWGSIAGQPIQQLIPLITPLRDPLTVERVQLALQNHLAFTTDEQIEAALNALVRIHILIPAPGGGYRFRAPLTAWLHRLQNGRRVDALAEYVRNSHPLYAGARTFFTRAEFQIVESNPEVFILVPGPTHPHANYKSIYTRLIAGRSPKGDDFEEVAEAARHEYGSQVEHRLAFIVSNRRPTPGARFRLYEIWQRWGLAIVHIDSELFNQVKPNMPAADILTAQIDQATGQQNLYLISSPVSDDLSFFGRESMLQQLIDLIDTAQPVGIFGLRKTGKTSLSQRLQGRLATRRVIAAVDTQGTAREQGVLPLYSAIIGAFVAHIEQYRPGLARTLPPLNLWPPSKGAGAPPANVMSVFDSDLAALHTHIGGNERLLLILDEVDRLLPAGDDPGYEGFASFLGQLRAANQNLKLLDFIVIGVDPGVNRRDKWGERDNELYQALCEIWMPPMEAENAAEMIESIGFQMGIKYEPEALRLLVDAGGGHPFVTRQVCGQAVKGLFGKGTVTINADQAEQGIEEFVFQAESYLTELWRVRMDEAGRRVLLTLAQADGPIPRRTLLPTQQRQEMLSILGSLQECTIIDLQDDGYIIGWGVLRNWIRWIELGLED